MSSPSVVVLLGVVLPMWGAEIPDLEARGYKHFMTDDPNAFGMRKLETSQQLGSVAVGAILYRERLETLILETKCSPEELSSLLGEVRFCKESKGVYRCVLKGAVGPLLVKVCGGSLMIWKEGDPEVARQIDLACRVAQSLYKSVHGSNQEGVAPGRPTRRGVGNTGG